MFVRNRKIQNLILLVCAAALTAQPVTWAAQGPPPRQSAQVAVPNLDGVDINEFVNHMSRLLNLSPIVIDPLVQGTVYLTSSRDDMMSPEDLFSTFNLILKNNSAALVRQQGLYQIIPVASALKNSGVEIITQMPDTGEQGSVTAEFPPARFAPQQQGRGPENAGISHIATHVIRVEFMPVRDLIDVIRLMVTEGTVITPYERLNMLLITDYTENAARIGDLVRMLDTSFLDPDLTELVKIEYNNAVEIADDLKKIFGSGEANAATGVSFVPLDRLNAIFVMASTRRGLTEAKRWIKDLDADDGNKFQTFVYIVQNSTASNIAMMLSALYGGNGSGSSTTGTGGRNTQNNSSSNSLLNNFNSGSDGYSSSFGSSRQLGPQINTSARSVTVIVLSGGTSSGLRDEARVVVDDINNSLHIVSTPADYRQLLGTIERMDTPPRQVVVDVEVYEVDLTGELSYGFSGILEELKRDTAGNLLKNMTTTDLTNEGVSFGTFATVGSTRQITMAMAAMKQRSKMKILEHPTLTAMDGTPAYFQSGAEVPYPKDSFMSSTGGTSTGMDYRPTGVNLSFTPIISASGAVTLQISQEVSSVSERTVAGIAAPIFLATTVATTLSIRDGETVAIAGLIRDSNIFGRAGVPVLSDIPLIGGLFGATSRNNQRTELIILLTPHVMGTQEQYQESTQKMRDSLRNVRKAMDEYEAERIKDIENARREREKQELSDVRKIKPPKKEK